MRISVALLIRKPLRRGCCVARRSQGEDHVQAYTYRTRASMYAVVTPGWGRTVALSHQIIVPST